MFAPSTDRPDFATWSDAALCDEIRERSVAVERAQAELTLLTGVWLARQAWRSESGLSSRSWLAEHTPMTRASAAKLCTTARLVHRHEQTAKALDVGDVTVAHVEVLAAAARRREALYPEHEDVLLEAARSLTPDDLVTVARQWRELADDAAGGKPTPRPRTPAGSCTSRRLSAVAASTGSSIPTPPPR